MKPTATIEGAMPMATLLLLLMMTTVSSSSRSQTSPEPKRTEESVVTIPFTQYQLKSGMNVILHHDKSQPRVVVNLNVQVGSRDEKPGRTGFAHLFEHLMFMGTKRVPEKKFDEWMEQQGGWNNAWTSTDRTDYYDVAPSHALPLLLWMEADRMTSLGGQIDKAKLDTQRGVVRNERRQQTENQPYGAASLRLVGLLYPKGHPYHHPVIGSHEDLESATVSDVKEFFDTHYVPSNVSLVVAGDFDETATRQTIEKYFGSWKAAKPARRPAPKRAAQLGGVIRETLEDNVTLPKVIMAWLSPAHYAAGDAELDLLASVASEGKTSRLYQALVYEKKLAQSVVAYQASKALQSYFTVQVVARPGVDLDTLEKAIDEQLDLLRKTAVSPAELARAATSYEMGFVSRMQSLERRASLLNGYFANLGDPGWVGRDLLRYQSATPEGLLEQAARVLDPEARVILRVVPRATGPAPPSEGKP